MSEKKKILWRLFEELVWEYLDRTIGCHYPHIALREAGDTDDARNKFISGDGGRDYIITTTSSIPKNIHLFGIELSDNSNYLVEVKYTSGENIGFQRVSGNLSKSQDTIDPDTPSRYQGAALVTNAHLAPSAHWSVCEYLAAFRDGLVIVDGVLLQKHCERAGMEWPKDIGISPPKTSPLLDDIEFFKGDEELDHIGLINLFYTFYNRSDKERPLEVRLLNNEHWNLVDGHGLDRRELSGSDIATAAGVRPMVLRPWESRTVRLCGAPAVGWLDETSDRSDAREALHGALSRLEIVCASGREIAPMDATTRYTRFIFEPRLSGAMHQQEVQHLHRFVADAGSRDGVSIILLDGKAGVGKSRVIREMCKMLPKGGRFKTGRCVVEPGGGVNEAALADARKRFAGTYPHHATPVWADEKLSVEDLLSAVCAPDQKRHRCPVFCLEDAHNASEELLQRFRGLTRAKGSPCRAIILLSARDDDEGYEALVGALGISDGSPSSNEVPTSNEADRGGDTPRSPVRVSRRTVPELTDDAAHQMIASIIPGIDDASIDRILELSGPIPHHIVQCIEHLLDDALVSVMSRATLSITDAFTFTVRLKELPGSMLKLYASRFAKLRDTNHGSAAQDVLIAIALGAPMDEGAFGIVGGAAEWARTRLFDRGFLRHPDWAPEQIEWGHESFLLFFRNVLRDAVQALPTKAERMVAVAPVVERITDAARRLHADRDAFAKLDGLVQGAVTFLIGDAHTARDRFSDMLAEIRAINTFSTTDLKTEYYDFIDYAVAMERDTENPDPELLIRLIPAKGYIGAFNKSLAYAVQADEFGQHVLQAVALSESQKRWGCFWLDSIIGHVYMDAGRLGAALERMLELQGRLHFIPEYRDDQRLIFEIHNCLRLLYTYANFGVLSELHGRLADEAATRHRKDLVAERASTGAEGGECLIASRNEPLHGLVGMGLGDEALRHFLTDPARCLALNQESLGLSQSDGTRRHVRHGIASVIACQLAARRGDRAWLKERDREIAELIEECESDKYMSIIPRLHLLRATLLYLDAVATEAEVEAAGEPDIAAERLFRHSLLQAKLGLDACTLHVVGYISWQIRNLNAVIAMRRKRIDVAVAELETAMELLRNEDLFFMGDDGLISVAPVVIANYLTVPAITNQRRRARLASIRGFATYPWKELGSFTEIQEFARKYHHVVRRLPETPPGLIIDERAKMAVVCWF